MIESVPGITGNEELEKPSTVPDRTVPVPITDFGGDPRGVIGHPSNPYSGVAQAYGEHLRKQEEEKRQTEDARLEALGQVAITEVPPEIKNPQR